MPTAPGSLDTARLELRRWCADDAVELRALLDANDAHLRPWIPFMEQEPRSLAATRAWLGEIRAAFDAGTAWRYAIRTRADAARGGLLVGETMLLARGGVDTVEAGYWLAAAHCGRGYATEATVPLLPLAFDRLARRRVVLKCDVRNVASQRVADRLGAVAAGEETLAERGATVTLRIYEVVAPSGR